MNVTVENSLNYVFQLNNRTITLDKAMVDEYSDIVCPVDERYLSYMLSIFDKHNEKDKVLSAKLEFDMIRELSGYER